MEKHNYPILEFDATREAILEPSKVVEPLDAPEHCVICFFAEVIESLVADHGAKVIAHSLSQIGKHPLYEIEYEGQRLAFFHPGIGQSEYHSSGQQIGSQGNPALFSQQRGFSVCHGSGYPGKKRFC